MRQAEQQARAQQSAIRQEHIVNLQNDRDALAMELARLQQELANQNANMNQGPRRTIETRPIPFEMMSSHPQMIQHDLTINTDAVFAPTRPKRRSEF